MALSCSTRIVRFEIRSVQVGINDLDDMVENGSWHLTQSNEATQALMGLEQHQKASFGNRAFRRTEREKAFWWRGSIHLFQIFRRQAPLEARIRRALNCRHMLTISTDGCIG